MNKRGWGPCKFSWTSYVYHPLVKWLCIKIKTPDIPYRWKFCRLRVKNVWLNDENCNQQKFRWTQFSSMRYIHFCFGKISTYKILLKVVVRKLIHVKIVRVWVFENIKELRANIAPVFYQGKTPEKTTMMGIF